MENGRKDSQLQIRVSAKEKAAIRRAATLAGVDVSSWVLSKISPPTMAQQFQALVRRLARESDPSYCLAEINSLLSSSRKSELDESLRECEWRHLSPFLANYLAAMVETTAYRAGFPAPGWTSDVKVIEIPHFASSLLSLRPYLLSNSPPAFRRRNIFIDATIGSQV